MIKHTRTELIFDSRGLTVVTERPKPYQTDPKVIEGTIELDNGKDEYNPLTFHANIITPEYRDEYLETEHAEHFWIGSEFGAIRNTTPDDTLTI